VTLPLPLEAFSKPEFGSQPLEPSRYIRTAWTLFSRTTLQFNDGSRIRYFGEKEAKDLAELIQKRNVFARHSRENDFYIQRALGLADHTIVEVFRPGEPEEIAGEVGEIARTLERLTVLSSVLAMNRERMQRTLGVSEQPQAEVDFVTDSQYRFLRSRKKRDISSTGIEVNDQFCARFRRCGFDILADFVLSGRGFASRVGLSQQWLFASRVDPSLSASVVKTAIALESLLIISESESLAQTLSERAAFILSSDPVRRLLISRIIKRFYDARSGIVHGSNKKAKMLSSTLVEIVDRLAIMLHLVIAANDTIWCSPEELRKWCELERWSEPSNKVVRPFPDLYLRNALSMSEQLEPRL
jgi:hypothetical protein